jgi:small-conductance mechanosensitive channel
MVTKALPLFALLVCFALMAIAPARRFAMRVAIEVALLVGVGLPLLLRGARLIPNPAKPDEPWLEALAVVWWMVAARLVVTLVTPLATRTGHGRQERLFSDLVKAAIYLSTVLFVLNSVLQFPVQGLLATSGVIAIVLGLALQNTLADVFAGIAVGVEQPFHVGDEILVAEHAEGIVVEMNWRLLSDWSVDAVSSSPSSSSPRTSSSTPVAASGSPAHCRSR